MKAARGRRDVGVAHQALDDMDVLASALEARGVAVAPSVGEVPTAYARQSSGLCHQILQGPMSLTTAEFSVTPRIGEEVGRRWEPGPHLFQVLPKRNSQKAGDRVHPRFAALADERDSSSLEIDL